MVKFDWFSTIEKFNVADWNKLFNNREIKSYSFFYALEKANLLHVNMIYLRIYKKDKTLAIIPCFKYKLNIGILSNSFLKSFLATIRKIYPSFLYVDILGIGSVAATCEQHIGVCQSLSKQELKDIQKIIHDQIVSKSRELSAKLIVVKEVPHGELNKIKELLPGYHFFDSLPNSFIPVNKQYPYPQALKRNGKKRYRKSIDKFNELYTWEQITDFKHIANEIEDLYLQVLNRSKNKFETMSSDFFKHISSDLGSKTYVFAARHKETREVAVYEFVIEEVDRLIPMYIGIDYNISDDIKTLYFNTIFHVIKEAEIRNKSFVVLGQTSYYPKILSGAFIERLFVGFYANNRFLRFVIRNAFKYLFKPTCVMQQVYPESICNEYISLFESRGFIVNNK